MYRGKLFIEDTVRRNHWVSTITIFPWKCYCLGGRGLLLCDKEILCLWQKPLNEETKDRVCLSPHPISHHIYTGKPLLDSTVKDKGMRWHWGDFSSSPQLANDDNFPILCLRVSVSKPMCNNRRGSSGISKAKWPLLCQATECWQLPSSHDDLSINSCNQPYNGLKKSKLFTV